MGEYAKIKKTGEEVKIGTCNEMFGIRFTDKNKVDYDFNFFPVYWRLPFPDEDEILPGKQENWNRSYRLHKCYFDDQDLAPGKIQFLEESQGLLFSIPCYHGQKLPEGLKNAGWNGKCSPWELASIKEVSKGKFLPVVRCKSCRQSYTMDWEDVLPFIYNAKFKKALEFYQKNQNKSNKLK